MHAIPLNELTSWSPWPGRLIGTSPWTAPSRDVEKVGHEYDDGKYLDCLRFFEQAEVKPDAEKVQNFEIGHEPNSELCFSRDNELYVASVDEFRQSFREMLSGYLGGHLDAVDTIVELGSGYGYNLSVLRDSFPDMSFVGGDYSQRAVSLGKLLFAADERVQMAQFNFYDEVYEPLERARGRVVVFTNHAVEQLPTAENLIATLERYKDRISMVFHFEPLREVYRDDLFGLLRRRYVELNDYNRDLLTLLQGRADVELHGPDVDVLGINPLNPTSVIRWRFVD